MEYSLTDAYLRLRHSDQISPAKLARQLRDVGNMQSLLDREPGLFQAVQKPGAHTLARVDAELAWASETNNALLVYEQSAYPPRLREIDCPPPVLAVRGDAGVLTEPQLAIVGSRKCSSYGRRTSFWLGRELADCGLGITSGLAVGVDAAAHQGALSAAGDKGASIAVVATGLDTVYPRQHRPLMESLIEKGAVVSEFPLGTPPRAAHFPQRNRLISGLSQGVLVIEAGLRSGSLITARLAMEQNREVFALPGRIDNALARGCHHLLRNGAKLIEGPADILEELNPELLLKLKNGAANRPLANQSVQNYHGDQRCRKILQSLAQGEMLFEVLQGETGLSPEILQSCLLQLELQGFLHFSGGSAQLCDNACQG
ncbi:MAG: DNA-processing protein DprA [Pseudomonadales bacterium]|nr:DNA-processing protein DprA [Pseudomonadales bacterium]